LKFGTFKHINTNSEVYSFIRDYEDESVIVLINNSDEEYKLSSDLTKYDENIMFETLSDDSEEHKFEDSRKLIVHLPAGHFNIIFFSREKGELKIRMITREL